MGISLWDYQRDLQEWAAGKGWKQKCNLMLCNVMMGERAGVAGEKGGEGGLTEREEGKKEQAGKDTSAKSNKSGGHSHGTG